MDTLIGTCWEEVVDVDTQKEVAGLSFLLVSMFGIYLPLICGICPDYSARKNDLPLIGSLCRRIYIVPGDLNVVDVAVTDLGLKHLVASIQFMPKD